MTRITTTRTRQKQQQHQQHHQRKQQHQQQQQTWRDKLEKTTFSETEYDNIIGTDLSISRVKHIKPIITNIVHL